MKIREVETIWTASFAYDQQQKEEFQINHFFLDFNDLPTGRYLLELPTATPLHHPLGRGMKWFTKARM